MLLCLPTLDEHHPFVCVVLGFSSEAGRFLISRLSRFRFRFRRLALLTHDDVFGWRIRRITTQRQGVDGIIRGLNPRPHISLENDSGRKPEDPVSHYAGETFTICGLPGTLALTNWLAKLNPVWIDGG